ncbi:hydantoinase/oxoprolinase family protein [Paludisphaera mucosa]|uniref:Hydantoinase/oxoprolinase family protein n=1 Tax=Paludisphaera mucosa TaxID=3030827 RepID=A0ABT6FFT5_9BACT|nr:hydantoinase/oxoprolinase family protein [Paludisphaera mucosa]MDG3006392.1 hydantoinase/oxoprolinase family protein [Paludisphaera mucosa]
MKDDRGPLASATSWLAIDVGGANLKAAHSSGVVRSSPFAVWKDPAGLGRAIAELAAAFPTFERVAATMTAELCDCFETKREGVLRIVDALREGLPDRPPRFWGTDGRFHDEASIRSRPLLAAASNWLALGTVAARAVGEARAILIDVGSTTTDLIPLVGGRVAARGRTDVERLQNGELVYAGVLRTPVCALAVELLFQGRPTGLAAEFFATTRDVYLTIGDLEADPDDSSTADGRPATRDRSIERLARMVCTDRESCSADDVAQLAKAADGVLLDRLVDAARRACATTIGEPATAIVSGSGEFLARRVAEAVVGPRGVVQALGDLWGPGGSEAGCARALIELLRGGERGDVLES